MRKKLEEFITEARKTRFFDNFYEYWKKHATPEKITKLSNLKVLDLRDNKLTKIPKEICKLKKIMPNLSVNAIHL